MQIASKKTAPPVFDVLIPYKKGNSLRCHHTNKHLICVTTHFISISNKIKFSVRSFNVHEHNLVKPLPLDQKEYDQNGISPTESWRYPH